MRDKQADPNIFVPDAKAVFDDGHHRRLPRLVKGPFKYVSDIPTMLALSLQSNFLVRGMRSC